MKTSTILFFLFIPIITLSQNNTVATGGTATGTNGSATFSIGQAFFLSTTTTNGTIYPGMQQPFEILTLSTSSVPQIQLMASVYPNPTSQYINLSVQEFDLTNLQYTLVDLQGKVIVNAKVLQNITPIDLSFLAAANYFLQVTQNNQNLKTFKIIKN